MSARGRSLVVPSSKFGLDGRNREGTSARRLIQLIRLENPANTSNVAWKRHRERGMYVFADGHAENLYWKETWAPRGPRLSNGNQPTMWRLNYEGVDKGWVDRP